MELDANFSTQPAKPQAQKIGVSGWDAKVFGLDGTPLLQPAPTPEQLMKRPLAPEMLRFYLSKRQEAQQIHSAGSAEGEQWRFQWGALVRDVKVPQVGDEAGEKAAVQAIADVQSTTAEKARQLCHRVYEMMAYEPETTTVETPAAEVFSRQCGVCQDYAHLMISFCRANGLPARYVNGFLEGTGQTHAWVEVFDGYSWQGYDPTHDRTLLQQGYVKIAHGRDSADCPVSRGMFRGQAVQQTQISVTLQEL